MGESDGNEVTHTGDWLAGMAESTGKGSASQPQKASKAAGKKKVDGDKRARQDTTAPKTLSKKQKGKAVMKPSATPVPAIDLDIPMSNTPQATAPAPSPPPSELQDTASTPTDTLPPPVTLANITTVLHAVTTQLATLTYTMGRIQTDVHQLLGVQKRLAEAFTGKKHVAEGGEVLPPSSSNVETEPQGSNMLPSQGAKN